MKKIVNILILFVPFMVATSARAQVAYYFKPVSHPFVCSDYDYRFQQSRIVEDFSSTSAMPMMSHEYAYKPTVAVMDIKAPKLSAIARKNAPRFVSTSSLAGSQSTYASTPVMDNNGKAVGFAYTVQRRVRLMTAETLTDDDERQGGTPGQIIVEPLPIGTAVPVLLLLAGIYAGVVALRRRKLA